MLQGSPELLISLLYMRRRALGRDCLDTPPKCLDRDCVGRRRTGTRHGDVHRSVREKQGIVVYRQRVLQTVASLGVVPLVFRGQDLLKRDFRYGKSYFPERAAEMESTCSSRSQLKGACPNVRTESKESENK